MVEFYINKGLVTFVFAQQGRTLSDRAFPTINPATKKKITTIIELTEADIESEPCCSPATSVAFDNGLKGETHGFTK